LVQEKHYIDAHFEETEDHNDQIKFEIRMMYDSLKQDKADAEAEYEAKIKELVQLEIKEKMVRLKYEKMMEDMKQRIEINIHNQELAEKEIE
jgi:hypothetical protein